jgi:hypothetical protein
MLALTLATATNKRYAQACACQLYMACHRQAARAFKHGTMTHGLAKAGTAHVQVMAEVIREASRDAQHDASLGLGDGKVALPRLLTAYDRVLRLRGIVPEEDTHVYQMLLRLSLDWDSLPDWWDKLAAEQRAASWQIHTGPIATASGKYSAATPVDMQLYRSAAQSAKLSRSSALPSAAVPSSARPRALQPLDTNALAARQGYSMGSTHVVISKIAAIACSASVTAQPQPVERDLLAPAVSFATDSRAHAARQGSDGADVSQPPAARDALQVQAIASAIASAWSMAMSFRKAALLRRMFCHWHSSSAEARARPADDAQREVLRAALAIWQRHAKQAAALLARSTQHANQRKQQRVLHALSEVSGAAQMSRQLAGQHLRQSTMRHWLQLWRQIHKEGRKSACAKSALKQACMRKWAGMSGRSAKALHSAISFCHYRLQALAWSTWQQRMSTAQCSRCATCA